MNDVCTGGRAFTLAKAADEIGVSLTTMKALVRTEIPVVRIGKQMVRVRARDLDAWLASLPHDRKAEGRRETGRVETTV
jgi:Helix-turn-helix domain